jgi:alanine racemase
MMPPGLPSDDAIALRPTTVTVDLSALEHNVRAIRARVGKRRIMGVVKANAYGHGLVPTAEALLRFGVDELGVAFLEEGIALRRAGVKAPILVLGGIIGNQITHFLEHDLEVTASSPYKLSQIEEVAAVTGRRAIVHLKVDTGMERIGVHWDHADRMIEAALSARHCEIRGLFTHFAASESNDRAYTELQLERFEDVLGRWRRRGFALPMVHAANSGAILQHEHALFDLVRPGALLYGFYPSREVTRSIEVHPALSLKTRVVYFKVVRAGSPVSYGGRWRAERDTRVVTIPVGYGDGYMRALSGKASVLINGKRYPIIGAITMDAMMVDVGQDSAFNGDEVVLIGMQGKEAIHVEELAELAGTIPYEILTSINTRVPRRYN